MTAIRTRPRAFEGVPTVANPSARPDLYQIGEVAERLGLSLRTVRYYEEVGLLTPSGRSQGGFRLFTESAIDRLALIKQMKPLGFTIEEMRELLTVCDSLASGVDNSEEQRQLVERLAGFASTATAKFETLRAQLAVAEVFADTLYREVRRHRSSLGDQQS